MHRLPPALLLALSLPACGDSGTSTASDSTTAGPTTPTAASTSGDQTPTTAGPGDPGSSDGGGGNTDVLTSTTAATATTTAAESTTTAVTATTTAAETTAPETTTTDTTQACVCTPGEVSGCNPNGDLLVCGDDCLGFGPVPCDPGLSCVNGVCSAESDLCALAEATPSSIGCSFLGARQDNYDYANIDSLVVGNTSKTDVADVQLYFVAEGTNVEVPLGAPVAVMPGKSAEFKMDNQPFKKVSGLRKGGVYRVQSSIPVVAYQHSPINGQATNDSSMLLPEHALKQDHVIASYRDTVGGEDRPSYFNVIATTDGTTVEWTPPIATTPGNGVPAVAANQTGMVVMNRFDMMQVRVADDQDITGTYVHADKPIWVVGGVNCAFIPANQYACDHCEEQILPLDYWGKQYVGAHSPLRGSEKHYWRIFGGDDGTVVTATPAVPGSPVMVNKGQWKELVLPTATSTIFSSDKPFLAVQYLESQEGGGGNGDPAMYQMIPVEQFLSSYAFVTGVGYDSHYVQVIRKQGNPDVLVDGVVVGNYYAVGNYEVSDVKISEGPHFAESAAPFGIVSVGYTGFTSYAYPGGLKLAVINPQ